MVMFFLLLLLSCRLLLLLLIGWLGLINFYCHWLRAQSGNRHCCNADIMWWSSLTSWSCVEETTLALCTNVLNTLCLAVMWWLLSQCRYWSVWVGFLYTEVLNVLSCCMVTRVSRNGSEPCCVDSTVNCMCGSWLLMCWRSAWLCSALLMTKVSWTNLSQREGGGGGTKGFYFKLFHEDVGCEGADGGPHSCTLYLFIILSLEEEVSVGEAELQ